MTLTADDIIRLARHARFSLSPEEVERFRTQLNAVLLQMDALDELSDAPNAINVRDGGTSVRLRADEIRPDVLELPIEKLTTDLVAGFFTVPRVLGETGRTQ